MVAKGQHRLVTDCAQGQTVPAEGAERRELVPLDHPAEDKGRTTKPRNPQKPRLDDLKLEWCRPNTFPPEIRNTGNMPMGCFGMRDILINL